MPASGGRGFLFSSKIVVYELMHFPATHTCLSITLVIKELFLLSLSLSPLQPPPHLHRPHPHPPLVFSLPRPLPSATIAVPQYNYADLSHRRNTHNKSNSLPYMFSTQDKLSALDTVSAKCLAAETTCLYTGNHPILRQQDITERGRSEKVGFQTSSLLADGA